MFNCSNCQIAFIVTISKSTFQNAPIFDTTILNYNILFCSAYIPRSLTWNRHKLINSHSVEKFATVIKTQSDMTRMIKSTIPSIYMEQFVNNILKKYQNIVG